MSSSSDAPDPLPERELATLRAGLCLLARRALADADQAEDIAQDALARTVAALAERRVRDVPHLGAFAYGVARNLIREAHRARSRRPGDSCGLTAVQLPDGRPDPLECVVAVEELARVHSALEEMPVADRELLRQLYVDGMKSEEIALLRGEPPERIRKRKERALKRLRELFLREARSRCPRPSDSRRLRGAE